MPLFGEVPHLERDILPIFAAHCTACHGPQNPAAELDLTTPESVLRGSKAGPVVVPGAAERSPLYQKLTNGMMPPPGLGDPLSAAQIRAIQLWIDIGISQAQEPPPSSPASVEARKITDEDRQFWSFRKPVRPPVPNVKARDRVRTPIDAFVLARLEGKGLTVAPDASKARVLRRAYLDVTGLPPSAQEIEQFLADTKPGAYERLISRLLESPHYGERWGRHWLDLAGYSDTKLFDNDAAARFLFVNDGIWRYRDYVIRSFNRNKPFDDFLTEQLAGDELVDWRNATAYTPETLDLLLATGYLRNVPYRTSHEGLAQMVETLSSGVLGLTVKCAQCHDHKYDPISQTDYYRLSAIFAPVFLSKNLPKDDYLPDVSKKEVEEIDRFNAEIENSVSPLKKQLEKVRSPHRERLQSGKFTKIPEALREDLGKGLEAEPAKRSPIQSYLVSKLGRAVEVTPEELDAELAPEELEMCKHLQSQIDTFESWKKTHGKIQVGFEPQSPEPFHLLFRGDVKTPGPVVQPGFPEVLAAPDQADLTPAKTVGETSGRRLALARWLTSPEHPLTARVAVNRVWQQYFGEGIVATPDNFGRMGAAPTHPKLLDWLAVEFMESGWDLKKLQWLILTSTTYRQDSVQHSPELRAKAEESDPGNKLFWHARLRRLEAEVVRDSLLAVSGMLRRDLGGEPTPLHIGPEGSITIEPDQPRPGDHLRRSLYIFARRNYPLKFLETFDYPLMAVNCTRRIQSSTPLQSLTLLNSEFVLNQAEHFATRVTNLAGSEATAQKRIQAAFLLAYARPPSGKEFQLAATHLERQQQNYERVKLSHSAAGHQALVSMCQMLMASNEFLYIQ